MKSTQASKVTPSRRFRIQEAILILRQGKSHPMWREAAWHLIEHAGKDTQLLLEAQRDLLLSSQPQESPWPRRILLTLGLAVLTTLISAIVWVFLNHEYLGC
ncbi:hypothetical protein HF888_13310 [Bermanella marisrubri]|uniref:Uncharacterized protein n=1 Tax=Bermanella marisrubri TaxID=207949 RepID=Q1N348_9GAMM|nr:hypothetical protein [Bermanella marisrubri]EAT12743.1 hypothetical protein RED65_13702 [Oceanobacter sp. RED65] [Bermanella marisrubri]QIZ85140.1 hypothetical protein HF888_13310 [Bermanella marisrubri]